MGKVLYWVSIQDDDGVGTPSAVEGIGYSEGVSVTQGTSRTTAVTANGLSGTIKLVSAAGSTTAASFTVNNSEVRAADTILLSQRSGTDKYELRVSAVADGSFQITFNTVSGTTTEQPEINFTVIRG